MTYIYIVACSRVVNNLSQSPADCAAFHREQDLSVWLSGSFYRTVLVVVKVMKPDMDLP